MNIHCFQHVAFEKLGCIESWIVENNHTLTTTRFFEKHTLPDVSSIDFLIVMGGPMGIYDYEEHKWLDSEKEFIRGAISAGKIVLGICLGAQLIADVLGAKVFSNGNKEIGWLPVRFGLEFQKYATVKLNTDLNVFHWHGDTFGIPDGGMLHSSSLVCSNQLFTVNEKVMAIQFHLEVTPESVKTIVANCGNELNEAGDFIQSENKILDTTTYFKQSNRIMFDILDTLVSL